ncbi:hypothetical protein MMC19_007107 [Ptychographa xylographoides]|nr:hypothetical protein [Ptychographa xylographoides]
MESRNGRSQLLHPGLIDSDDDVFPSTGRVQPTPVSVRQTSRRKDPSRHSHPKPPLTPSTGVPTSMPQNIPNPLISSAAAPASPPTPAPSPTPNQRPSIWTSPPEPVEDNVLQEATFRFSQLNVVGKEAWLAAIVDSCDNHLLSYLHQLVSPRLKKDPFQTLPNELCFRILEFVDDPRTFVRASRVSRRWREVLSDDQAWKTLCEKHAYRRMSSDSNGSTTTPFSTASHIFLDQLPPSTSPVQNNEMNSFRSFSLQAPSVQISKDTSSIKTSEYVRILKRPRPKSTHRSHFKHKYLVESAWRKGGQMTAKHITPDQGVVTSLHLTKKYIVVALDNAKIHVFNTKGDHQRTLAGHVMGVWAMVPWGDTLVSGGCDRDVRVWNMATGASMHTLRGHTSTVRCLKMSDANTAISGSRDTTLRVWDIPSGTCRGILMGHQASVRCLEIHGDLVVSGSYDTTAKIWSISTGQCLRTLQGHFSQIYAIAFDGVRIATGSLDTSVRIWNPTDGSCQAILQGHTSLVGQLQMRGTTLVTGGSDGSVRVWSLNSYSPIHRLAAHDNSVTSLQFDDTRIVSGGSDGRVKIWDLKTGGLIRELSQPAEAVWRVAFEEERSVVLASRQGRTVMEVWDFAPPGDEEEGKTDRGPIRRDGGGMLDELMVDVQNDIASSGNEADTENIDMVDGYTGEREAGDEEHDSSMGIMM